jgi:hypothetical protein
MHSVAAAVFYYLAPSLKWIGLGITTSMNFLPRFLKPWAELRAETIYLLCKALSEKFVLSQGPGDSPQFICTSMHCVRIICSSSRFPEELERAERQ